MLSIVVTGSDAMPFGVCAKANNLGVIPLTRLSVHCADNKTAIRSVKGSLWSSGIGGSGYKAASRREIKAARCALPHFGRAGDCRRFNVARRAACCGCY